ncbi:MAG: glycerate kinase [Anaerolineales bacterium]
MPEYTKRKSHLTALRKAALVAADASAAVWRHLSLEGELLHVGDHRVDLQPNGNIYVISIGKAAPAMASAISALLRRRVTEGLVTEPRYPGIVGSGPKAKLSRTFQSIVTEHPLPGPGSLDAGLTAAALLAETGAEDLVLVLVSGGASAMIELPLRGVSVEELRVTNQLLLASGAPIEEINQVRGALSQLKSGGLARLAAPAQVVSLILSDVVGDRLGSIGSGPTVVRTSRPELAVQILLKYRIWEAVPTSIREALERPRPKASPARRPMNIIVGTNRTVLEAVAEKAKELGFQPRILGANMRGEARVTGWRLASRLRAADPGDCLIMGGETTVRIRGNGLGGRNQELALGAATALEGEGGFALMSLATDGIDGPTDAAGARIDAKSIQRAKKLGFHPDAALARNDAYPLLDAIGALIKTGPTGTNLNDIAIGLKYRG